MSAVQTAGGKPRGLRPEEVVLKPVARAVKESAATAHRRRAREYEHAKRSLPEQRRMHLRTAAFVTRALR